MEVQAINGISKRALTFGQLHDVKPEDIEQKYEQMDAPASRKAARGLRSVILGGAAALALAPGMVSCVDADADASAAADATAVYWGVGCGCNGKNDTTIIEHYDTIHDTVYRDTIITEIKPVYVKEYPFHIADSLIAQGVNIGVPLDGPLPASSNNDVVYVASKAHNCYDNKFYETHLDSVGTNKNCLSTITKVVDMYDDENPTTSWIRTEIRDVPGKGLKFTRSVATGNTEPKPYEYEYAGSEIRTNLRNGKNRTERTENGTTRVGYYTKGLIPGSYVYEATVPYNGETTYYNFDQSKMWSDKVKKIEVPNNTDFGYWY